MAEVRNACRILTGKPEEQATLKRPRSGAMIILKCMLKKTCGGVDWIRTGSSGGLF
jgi:hypothetical protein